MSHVGYHELSFEAIATVSKSEVHELLAINLHLLSVRYLQMKWWSLIRMNVVLWCEGSRTNVDAGSTVHQDRCRFQVKLVDEVNVD